MNEPVATISLELARDPHRDEWMLRTNDGQVLAAIGMGAIRFEVTDLLRAGLTVNATELAEQLTAQLYDHLTQIDAQRSPQPQSL